MVNTNSLEGINFPNGLPNPNPTPTPAAFEPYSHIQIGSQTNHLENSNPLPENEMEGNNIVSASLEQELNSLIRYEENHTPLNTESEAEQNDSYDDTRMPSTVTKTNEDSINSNEGIKQKSRAPYTNDELRQFYKDLLKPNSNSSQDGRIASFGFTSEELDRMNHICDVMDRFWKVVGNKKVMLGKRKR